MFWLLGVYRDVSGRHRSLLRFYRALRNHLADLVLHPSHSRTWAGCLATGDWNTVEHPDDRVPPSVPNKICADIAVTFTHVKSLCHLQDAAGHKAYLQGLTFTGTGRTTWSSHLDQVYHPQGTWWAKKPTTIPTLWSDHKLVWAECSIRSPRVQIAKAAPHLPNTDKLTKSKSFWGPALQRYSALTDNKVTLETWTTFKKDILTLGLETQSANWKNRSAEWKTALRGDAIPLEELPATIEAARWYVPKLPPSSWSCHWRSALGSDPADTQPWSKYLDKISRHWQSALAHPPLTIPDTPAPAHPPPYTRNPEPTTSATPWLTGRAPTPWALATELLAQRIESCRRAAIRKHQDMTLRHTTAWYRQLANKEAEERGSRASISVDSLCLSDATPPTTELHQMVEITQEYFVDLHTPEPNPPEWLAAKATLLGEVAQAYASLPPPPDPAWGPFTTKEIQAIRKRMPNTTPGPDSIQYSFWKALASQADDQELPPLWDTFLALTNDL